VDQELVGPGPGPVLAGTGGAGGSGIVIVKELNKATGVWSLKSQFSAVKSGTWPRHNVPVSLDYLVVAGGGGGGGGFAAAGSPNGRRRRWSRRL
jgi:hypothetical protein